MINLRRVAAAWSRHLWKRQIATPPLTRTAPFSTDDGDSEKAKLFQKLHCLTADYLDQISREQGVSLTGSDLADCAKSLSGDGNHERALEIYQWMEKNNMAFSPSDLENFVDLLCHHRGLVVAQAYLRKLDPGFSSMDPTAKNLPAFKMIMKRLLVGSSHIFLTRDTFSDALIKVGASLVYLPGDVGRGGNGGNGGSGFFINRNTIVTTYNVLLKLHAPYYIGKKIVVTLYTGAIVIGILSSYDSDRDLCLISIHDSKIEGINITWSKFSSDQPKQGQLVGALGAPLLFQNSFSMGAISYVNRLIEDIDDPFRDPYTNEDGLIPPNQPRKFPYIQTDMIIDEGCVGGPLFNTDGLVIGIICAGLVETPGGYIRKEYCGGSYGLAIPASEININSDNLLVV